VVAVEDGVDALRFAEQTLPAAVVLDLGLPRLAGMDVQRELAAHDHTRTIPIILVTGHSGSINEQGYACVLRKPIQPHELVAAVQRCLARAR
jgi:DNA-binding response OmpR family regulator